MSKHFSNQRSKRGRRANARHKHVIVVKRREVNSCPCIEMCAARSELRFSCEELEKMKHENERLISINSHLSSDLEEAKADNAEYEIANRKLNNAVYVWFVVSIILAVLGIVGVYAAGNICGRW